MAGISYGAAQSLELATLRNRMRLPDDQLVPFVSPKRHIPMNVAAVFAMWPWDDIDTAIAPNGSLSTSAYTPPSRDYEPIGVVKQSWLSLLVDLAEAGYVAPPNADPQANISVWAQELMAGEPYGRSVVDGLKIMQQYKSAIDIPLLPGGPAPTAIQSGWTDTLFPVTEALHFAVRSRTTHSRSPQLLMFADVGHGWASDKTADTHYTVNEGLDFLGSIMLTHRTPPTGVVAIPQTCPATAPSGQPRHAATFASLRAGSLTLGGTTPQVVTSSGGDSAVSAALNPAYAGKPLCNSMTNTVSPGTAVYETPVGSKPTTMLGGVQIHLRMKLSGHYPELVGRLWDVSANGTTRQIVALGVFRPVAIQRPGVASTATERATFELNPNDYTFAAGDSVELELVGSTTPLFRKSNGSFRITVTSLQANVPLG